MGETIVLGLVELSVSTSASSPGCGGTSESRSVEGDMWSANCALKRVETGRNLRAGNSVTFGGALCGRSCACQSDGAVRVWKSSVAVEAARNRDWGPVWMDSDGGVDRKEVGETPESSQLFGAWNIEGDT
jgi:hypothetical protein